MKLGRKSKVGNWEIFRCLEQQGGFTMKNHSRTIILYFTIFVVIFLTQSCVKKQIREVDYNNLSIQSSQKLLQEIETWGPDLLMNVDSYDILVEELENYNGEGIVINSLDGMTLDENKAYLKMLGYTSEEIRSITYQELTPAKWHPIERDLFEEVMKTGYSGVYEKEYIRKDGSIFPIRIQAWLLMDEKHKPFRLLGLVQDISGEKKGEE